MKAARFYGARDIRIEDVADPPSPQNGDVLLKVKAVGICGSDLHTFQDGRIGSTEVSNPAILGHEFMGEIAAVSENALDAHFHPLRVGQRVAVEPATPCWQCEQCEAGNPNLCLNHTFYGLYPEDGALQECMIVHGRNCFPIPDSISDGGGTLLETLGVAIHAVDLGKVKVANSVSVIGCGPVGMLMIGLLKLAGADPIFAFDKLDWRVNHARKWGADAYVVGNDVSPADKVMELTNGRGVDVSFEVAWADETVQQAADVTRSGGRVVLVGIPSDDKLVMDHSVARRKGLTIMMSRRAKHTYPRAIQLATSGNIDIDDLISDHVTLDETLEAFERNLRYDTGIEKVIIHL